MRSVGATTCAVSTPADPRRPCRAAGLAGLRGRSRRPPLGAPELSEPSAGARLQRSRATMHRCEVRARGGRGRDRTGHRSLVSRTRVNAVLTSSLRRPRRALHLWLSGHRAGPSRLRPPGLPVAQPSPNVARPDKAAPDVVSRPAPQGPPLRCGPEGPGVASRATWPRQKCPDRGPDARPSVVLGALAAVSLSAMRALLCRCEPPGPLRTRRAGIADTFGRHDEPRPVGSPRNILK
jgi:hypothetical protein